MYQILREKNAGLNRHVTDLARKLISADRSHRHGGGDG